VKAEVRIRDAIAATAEKAVVGVENECDDE
jgi:hypothetical protein